MPWSSRPVYTPPLCEIVLASLLLVPSVRPPLAIARKSGTLAPMPPPIVTERLLFNARS
ncbi:hypothetical protein STAL104432_04975 [Streptomyces albus]